MRFHGLMLVRDEADILPESIPSFLSWMDGLYVMDLGSTDGSWEILQDFASRDSRVVLHSHRPIIFEEGLRALLFDTYRDRFADGDWFVKADADEFYDVPPPEFVRTQLRAGETAVFLQWFYFRLTDLDVAQIQRERLTMAEERRTPIAQRRRYYKAPTYSEPRMFRYRSSMRWTAASVAPFNAGFVARARIPIRHYPHRDPWQMAARYRLRSVMMSIRGASHGPPQWALSDWRRDVISVGNGMEHSVEQDGGAVGLAAAPEHTSGDLRYWAPGEQLPRRGFSEGHLAGPATRLVQRVVHPLCLPILDRLREGYSTAFTPRPIPDSATQALMQAPPDPFQPAIEPVTR